MKAQYLLRFDDICPTMNWYVWGRIERILLEFDIRPILAVVPDNRDQTLKVDKPRDGFWDEVRLWQSRGWTIGMHGYQHLYVTDRAGLVGVNCQSEFSGLSMQEQETKLWSSRAIFDKEDVKPEVWVAPGHSFDEITAKLLPRVGMHYISDGFYLFPRSDSRGLVWVPQQFWRFRWMPFGIWTVCQHFNRWTEADLTKFRSHIATFRPAITNLAEVVALHRERPVTFPDRAYSWMHLTALKLARRMQPHPRRSSA